MPRPAPNHWTPPAGPKEPCPCGSGTAFAACCDCPGEMPLLKVAQLRPPQPLTGHAHPKCYMRSTNNCSTKISGEHYVSGTILAEFGNLRTSGLPWFGPGETRVGINSLTSNILCTRHNSALSPLDIEGKRMLAAIRDGINHVGRKSLSTRTLFRIVSGEAFELWGLKTLMGLLTANVARTEGAPILSGRTRCGIRNLQRPSSGNVTFGSSSASAMAARTSPSFLRGRIRTTTST